MLTAQFRTVLTAAACAIAFAAGAPRAKAQERSFDIPAQSLSGALVEYGRQSGDVVVAPGHLVAARTAPAVTGAMTPSRALEQLLAGSGLEAQRTRDGGITLAIADPAATRSASAVLAPAATLEEIVVTGVPLGELARAYARAVALTERFPRWNFAICPGVAGLAEHSAQALIDHIALRAHELGVRTQRSGCRPNILIVFASDGEQVARAVVDSRRDLLGARDTPVSAALERFVAAPRPVRWWHVSNAAPARTTGTRLGRSARDELSFALMVVDARRVGDAPSQALADYIAMAALAELDPDADMSPFATILNLFAASAGQPTPSTMSVWDHAYLHGLYEGRAEARDSDQQLADIARRMTERVERED